MNTARETDWQNGVTLKKIRDGYSWSISVASSGPTLEEMLAAVETARDVDDELRQSHGEPLHPAT